MPALGALLALVSAMVWGVGDFAGGLATRRGHPFQVLVISASAGVAVLTAIAIALREPLPPLLDVGWAGAAGLSGAVGIAALYRGLAVGSAAVVAPTAGVVTAAIPVVFSMMTLGWPQPMQLAGFLLAIMGIWLVARGPTTRDDKRAGFNLALLAGVGFGCFLILIAQVPAAQVFVPLAIARVITLVSVLLLLALSGARMPALTSSPMALVAGLCDAGGNVCYLFARQQIRLDVAAVLSSFYPIATVVLARAVLKEPVSVSQWVGAAACLAAVGLITG